MEKSYTVKVAGQRAVRVRRYDPGEIEEIRQAYEGEEESLVEIAERFGTTTGSLRQMASRRSWRRPKSFYRGGVPKKLIPPERYDTTKMMWQTGEPCKIIARWIGTSENKARDICTEEFGYRNLRQQMLTHYARRNRQMYNLRKNGVSVIDLADMYWISPKSVMSILSKMQKVLGKLPKKIKPRTLEEAKERVLDFEFQQEIERHERFMFDIINIVCDRFDARPEIVLQNTRGSNTAALIRHICIYIMNVEAGIPFSKISMLFGRDRTTASYGTRRIEWLREDERFDEDMDSFAEKFVADLKRDHGFIPPYELYFST